MYPHTVGGGHSPLMQLLNLSLSYWRTVQGPPPVFSTFILPSLEDCSASIERRHCHGSISSHRMERASFQRVSHQQHHIVKFWSLVILYLHTCHCGNADSCFFHMMDENMEDLATVLPHLENLVSPIPAMPPSPPSCQYLSIG